MDFSPTEEQEALGDLARDILTDHVTHQHLSELEAEAEANGDGSVFDRALWRRFAEAGITAAVVPDAQGGSGLGFGALLFVLEEAGRAVAPVPLIPTLVLGALTLAAHGTAEQRDRLLPGVADGSVILTAAGLDAGDEETLGAPIQAATDGGGGGLRLDGELLFVPYAQHADRVFVAAAANRGTVVVLVDPGADGVTVTPVVTTNRQPTATLVLDGVTVAETDIVAGEDRGAELAGWMAQNGAAAAALVQAGVCDRALEMTAAHASSREQFGKPIAEFQAVAQRAADAFIDAQMIRLTAREAVFRLDEGWEAAKEVHVAKFWAGDGGMRVVHAAQHLHGGLGVDLDYPLHRYFLWAKQMEHTLGTPTRELIRLGTVLADEPV